MKKKKRINLSKCNVTIAILGALALLTGIISLTVVIMES